MKKYNLIIVLNLILRISLLFLIPISLFGDGLSRFIPRVFQVLHGNFLGFEEPPLFFIIESFWGLFFKGAVLEFFWKLTPFLSFIGILFLLPRIYQILKVNDREKIIITSLLIFSVWSLLSGEAVMIEMITALLTLLLFIIIENPKRNLLSCLLIIIVSVLLLYSKQTSYFILAGFFLYTFFKKNKKEIILTNTSLLLSFVLFSPWIIKNYILSIPKLNPINTSIFIPLSNFFGKGFLSNVLNATYATFHYFWFIPLPEQVNFSGIIAIFYKIYYLSFILCSILMTFLIIFGMIKFYKEYKKYLFLILPLFAFEFLWNFLCSWYNGSGRYSFVFFIFLCFFAAKFIESIKNDKVKKLLYLMIIILICFFIITAFATVFRMDKKTDQLKIISETIKENNLKAMTNEVFAHAVVEYYSDKPLGYNNITSPSDLNLTTGDMILSQKDYKLFLKNGTYYVLRIKN